MRIRDHLRTRIGIHWRRKVRLLLVTGDEAAIEQLVPGLRQQHWLEGNRTVLIYGGSLASEPDREKYIALRKLRRGRPLDGIVRVMPSSHPDAADKRERPARAGKISELLGYAAPVWLWKLCDSEWPQADRAVQAVGLASRCALPRTMSPVSLRRCCPRCGAGDAPDRGGDPPRLSARLGQQLIDGDRAMALAAGAVADRLAAAALALRGLMFSLPEPRTVDPYQEADTSPAGQPHLLTLPATAGDRR